MSSVRRQYSSERVRGRLLLCKDKVDSEARRAKGQCASKKSVEARFWGQYPPTRESQSRLMSWGRRYVKLHVNDMLLDVNEGDLNEQTFRCGLLSLCPTIFRNAAGRSTGGRSCYYLGEVVGMQQSKCDLGGNPRGGHWIHLESSVGVSMIVSMGLQEKRRFCANLLPVWLIRDIEPT